MRQRFQLADTRRKGIDVNESLVMLLQCGTKRHNGFEILSGESLEEAGIGELGFL